jgi:hypothetical protein
LRSGSPWASCDDREAFGAFCDSVDVDRQSARDGRSSLQSRVRVPMKTVVVPSLRSPFMRDLLRAASSQGFDCRRYELQRQELAWVAASVTVQLAEDLESSYGRAGVTELGRIAAWSSMQHPLLAPLVAGAQRYFGAQPHGILSWAPAFWRVATRGLGHFSVARSERGVQITLRSAPPIVADSQAWCAEIRGRLLAGLDAVGCDGEIDVVAGREPMFNVRW